jgi:hypothetical protein
MATYRRYSEGPSLQSGDLHLVHRTEHFKFENIRFRRFLVACALSREKLLLASCSSAYVSSAPAGCIILKFYVGNFYERLWRNPVLFKIGQKFRTLPECLSTCILPTATYVYQQYKGNITSVATVLTQQYDKRIIAANCAARIILCCWLWHIAEQYRMHCCVFLTTVVIRTRHNFTFYFYIAYTVKREMGYNVPGL